MRLVWIILLWGTTASAYIPSVPAILKHGIFDGRRALTAAEIVFRHRIVVEASQLINIEERIVGRPENLYITWREIGGQLTKGRYSGKKYTISRLGKKTTKSRLFLYLFLGHKWESFRDFLISESFIRRDQLLEFKPGFVLEGDPKGWNMKENRMFHPDIFLDRQNRKISIAVIGRKNGGSKRAVYFSRDLKGVTRFEWVDSGSSVTWNFDNFRRFRFKKYQFKSYFPRNSSMEVNGTTIIQSELISYKTMSRKIFNNYRSKWSKIPTPETYPESFESALSILLSYR